MIRQITGDWEKREVVVDGVEFLPGRSQRIRNHSPDGFNWGYGGSGPAQLALALLLEETTMEVAERLYQKFKWDFVSRLPQSNFDVQFDVCHWVEVNLKQEGSDEKI